MSIAENLEAIRCRAPVSSCILSSDPVRPLRNQFFFATTTHNLCLSPGAVLDYSAIHDLPFVERSVHYECIDSTNSEAKKGAILPRNGMVVFVADCQTAGRGQRSNTFFSEVRGGLWVSVVVPLRDLSLHFTKNMAISIALCRALEHEGFSDIGIKWPNDIYLNGKKVCGILLETIPSVPGFLVIGFGLNVNVPLEQFPPDLQAIATSLFAESGTSRDLPSLLKTILSEYFEFSTQTPGDIFSLYSPRLFGIGRVASIGSSTGLFQGVDKDGCATIRTADGVKSFTAGPIRFSTRISNRRDEA